MKTKEPFQNLNRKRHRRANVPHKYHPKIQTYLKGIDPPKPNRGIRYAIAQGPSVVPADTSEVAIKSTLEFNIGTLEEAAYLANKYDAQLLTLPELFLSGYEFGEVTEEDQSPVEIVQKTAEYIQQYDFIDTVANIANDYNIAIVCPLPFIGEDPMGNSGCFDVAIVFDHDGSNLGIQYKTHLWGISERSWFNTAEFPPTNKPVIQGFDLPHDDTSPYAPFKVNDFPVGVGICYDAEFPEAARCLALNGSLLTTFPTAAPDSILPGQTRPYPDISQNYIPANALQNLNFCSYSNRAGQEYSVDKDRN